MLIGTLGLIGSGKGTVAEYLVTNHGFRQDSFASTLKDITAVLFNWDREMLEGATPESRAAREVVDEWWSKKLGISDFTPRLALQLIGTETFRNNFHKDIWMLATTARYKDGENVVISDARFPNEVKAIQEMDGLTVRVDRGESPEWWEYAIRATNGDTEAELMLRHHYEIHESEWAWANTKPSFVIPNNGTLDDLHNQVELMMTMINLGSKTNSIAY